MRIHRIDMAFRRLVSMVVATSVAAAVAVLPVQSVQAADTIQTLATSYQPTISETVDASGFRHPGMGITKDVLENLRTKVRAQHEPWNGYFNNMLASGTASRTPSIKNVGTDPTQPRFYGIDSQGS
jgi:hypothetical protein